MNFGTINEFSNTIGLLAALMTANHSKFIKEIEFNNNIDELNDRD